MVPELHTRPDLWRTRGSRGPNRLRTKGSSHEELFVKSYEGANIRNVALVGHSHSGKTSLASAMLYTSGAVPKLLRVDEGNTITDYEEEEIARLMTLSAATAYCEWHNAK